MVSKPVSKQVQSGSWGAWFEIRFQSGFRLAVSVRPSAAVCILSKTHKKGHLKVFTGLAQGAFDVAASCRDAWRSRYKCTRPGQRVHVDLIGPIEHPAKYSKAIPLIDSDDFVKSLQLAAETPTGYTPAID